MKKLVILLSALALCSCIKPTQESSGIRTVRLTNVSGYTLVFTNIDNGGDGSLWPESSFTLQPGEYYLKEIWDYDKKTSATIAPLAMDIEFDGQVIHLSRETGVSDNPCLLDHWRKIDKFTTHGPGIHYEFTVTDSVLAGWKGKE